MQAQISKTLILNKFLIPLNKFTDKAVIDLHKEYIECLSTTSTDKQSIIFYAKLNIQSNIEQSQKLNINNIKKLINAFSCITDEVLTLDIQPNHIAGESENIRFKYHLLEDGIIEKTTVNLGKINDLTYDFDFMLSQDSIIKILKACSFSVDTNKIYLYIKDNKLVADLTDKVLQNIDSITIDISDTFNGILNTPMIINTDIFKIISQLKMDKICIKINSERGIILFEIADDNFILKYITTSLIK